MKGLKWNFLLLAMLAALSIVGMGFSLGAKSVLGMIIFFILLISIMGYGFATKKRYREANKL